MAYRKIEDSKLTAIADGFRLSRGTTEKYTLDMMATLASEKVVLDELLPASEFPTYMRGAVQTLADKIRAVQTESSITFLAMSDNHHYGRQGVDGGAASADGVQTNESNLHMAMAAKALTCIVDFDFMVHLGDAAWGHKTTFPALLESQIKDIFDLLHEADGGFPCFRAIGNHDTGIYYHNNENANGNTGVYTESGQYLYNAFTALSASDDTAFGGQANGGYCYRDFPDKKLRVFLLNTSESLVANQTDYATLGSQRKWFANALINLNSKSDAADWQWILLSHYPADYGETLPLSRVIKAYVEGKSITISIEDGTSTTINFSGKNAAKVVGQFHGHIHNFLVSKLFDIVNGSPAQYDAWRVSIPNGQYNRENYYGTVAGIDFAEPTSYPKTPDTVQETSFVINVIRPDEQKIYSFCYGAGYDRVIGYAATIYYSITTSLTNVTLTGSVTNVEKDQPYTATLSVPDGYEMSNVKITMGGADITSSVYTASTGVISISAVTGNVVITASAVLVPRYTNQIPISTDVDGSVYNGKGYSTGSLSSSGAVNADEYYSVTGFIPAKSNDELYFSDVNNDNTTSYCRISLYTSAKVHIATINGGSSKPYYATKEYDANGIIKKLTIMAGDGNTAYVRIAAKGATGINANSVITRNEEIV